MEAEITCLNEALLSAFNEKEEAVSRNKYLNSEIEALSEKLGTAGSEIKSMKEEMVTMVFST